MTLNLYHYREDRYFIGNNLTLTKDTTNVFSPEYNKIIRRSPISDFLLVITLLDILYLKKTRKRRVPKLPMLFSPNGDFSFRPRQMARRYSRSFTRHFYSERRGFNVAIINERTCCTGTFDRYGAYEIDD